MRPNRTAGAASPKAIAVSISFDFEHDRPLYELLLEQSRDPGSSFAVSGGSERFADTEKWNERARQRIRRADQVIIICGEHTDGSEGVNAELRIAQEEEKPYFLLWGRRNVMCTKPAGSKNRDGMYSWTAEIIQDQIASIARHAHQDRIADALKR